MKQSAAISQYHYLQQVIINSFILLHQRNMDVEVPKLQKFFELDRILVTFLGDQLRCRQYFQYTL